MPIVYAMLVKKIKKKLLASDKIISPVTPSEFSLEGLEITAREIGNIEKSYKATIPVCPILNEFDPRTSPEAAHSTDLG